MVQGKSLILVTILSTFLIVMGLMANGYAQQESKTSGNPAVKQPSTAKEQYLSPRQIRTGLEIVADLNVNLNKYTGPCPAQFIFTGKIHSNKATTIHYRFIRGDGTRSLMTTLNFEKPGTREVTDTWQFDTMDKSSTFNGWEFIQITFPKKANSNITYFEVACTNREQPVSGDLQKSKPVQPGQPVPGGLPGQQMQPPAPGSSSISIPQPGQQEPLPKEFLTPQPLPKGIGPGGAITPQPGQQEPLPKEFLTPQPLPRGVDPGGAPMSQPTPQGPAPVQ